MRCRSRDAGTYLSLHTHPSDYHIGCSDPFLHPCKQSSALVCPYRPFLVTSALPCPVWPLSAVLDTLSAFPATRTLFISARSHAVPEHPPPLRRWHRIRCQAEGATCGPQYPNRPARPHMNEPCPPSDGRPSPKCLDPHRESALARSVDGRHRPVPWPPDTPTGPQIAPEAGPRPWAGLQLGLQVTCCLPCV